MTSSRVFVTASVTGLGGGGRSIIIGETARSTVTALGGGGGIGGGTGDGALATEM